MAPSTDTDSSRQGATPARPPLVTTRGDLRTLEFVAGEVQSEMRLSRPSALVLAYSRAMMCFALFVPRPRHILMVGLGGGSLAKFCYRHFPQARITVLELRADVIALRDEFRVPPDDARFTVLHADATAYLAGVPDSVDVLLVDGFDAAGLPPALGSSKFYADCRRALRHGGVLTANIFSYDPLYPAMLGRLRLTFGGQVCWFEKVAGNNRILFAVKAPLDTTATAAAPPRGRALLVLDFIARRRRLGFGILNRLLVIALVAYLERRRF
ncbi:MAG: Transferase spermidine synthase [Massilia sp.]|jgi:spermidine synthase|nr:Transferase spermidine synthase [Massilia sp.]MDB5950209.1 Transferase spermidine synthase [Massilia sp.]